MNKLFLLLALFVASVATMQAQITAPKEEPAANEYPYAKYLEPLAEEDGFVVIERVLTLPDTPNAEETLTKMNEWLDRCMKDTRVINSGPVEAEEPNSVRRFVQQEIVFSAGLLATDKAEIDFCIDLRLNGNQLIFRMMRISYRYNGDNPQRKMLRITAEDYISDKVAVNKKKTKLVLGYRKFRVKTIDLADEYAESLKMAFWAK